MDLEKTPGGYTFEEVDAMLAFILRSVKSDG